MRPEDAAARIAPPWSEGGDRVRDVVARRTQYALVTAAVRAASWIARPALERSRPGVDAAEQAGSAVVAAATRSSDERGDR